MATYFRSFLNDLKGMRGATVPLQLREVFCDKRISSNTNNAYVTKKKALYLSVNVFSTKVPFGDTIFYAS